MSSSLLRRPFPARLLKPMATDGVGSYGRAVLLADLDTVFARWVWCRAVLHRGWWLVASVYMVVDARLSV
jgi:hypothetical protein